MVRTYLMTFGEKVRKRRNEAKEAYQRYEKYGPLAAFVVGFAYDTLTLTRIDRLSDNLILLAYLLVAGLLIVVLGQVEEGSNSTRLTRYVPWFTTATHFFLGGLLSSYVVFYFKSAAVGRAYIFVGLLVGLMLANEFFAHRLGNLRLLCALYYFCSFAFLTFFLPVLFHVMGDGMFLLSGLLSFIPTALVVLGVYRRRWADQRAKMVRLAQLPGGILMALVLMYFLNWIPPVPLALKDGGIYRSVKRVGDKYEVQYQEPPWWQRWRDDERRFQFSPGDTVYCFAAIFAPTALKEKVVHQWQQESADGRWINRDRLGYPIVGGRDGGYRGYTLKRKLSPGHWRVEVQTAEGRLLGRIPFEIIPAQGSQPPLRTDLR
jgi:hypothetical protein